MDERVEIIPVEIPCAIYEKNIAVLVKSLLEIDERLFGNESKTISPKEVEAA